MWTCTPTVEIKAAGYSETLVISYVGTRCHHPKDHDLNRFEECLET
jgi:hypothetical protein